MKTTKQNRSFLAAALLLLPIVGIGITGCEPEDNPYDLYPTVWIEEPTSDPAYTTSENTINIGGVVEIARDEVYVTNLRTGTQYDGITTFNSQERKFVWTV